MRFREPGAPVATWQVTVTSADERFDAARIELRRIGETPLLATRELAFLPEDAPRERWASIGVLIAALVVARSREAEAPSSPPEIQHRLPPHELPPPPPSPPTASPPVQGMWRLDLHALLSRRLAQGPPEFGAQVRASVLPGQGPWFGIASIAAAHRPGTEPSMSWLSTSVGLGARIGRPARVLAAEFSGGGVVEYWVIGASESGRSEHVGEFRVGGFAGGEGLWAVHPRWILSLGAEGRVVAPRFRVDVSGHTVERVPEHGWLMFAGLRFIP